jgi:hypothetical protein
MRVLVPAGQSAVAVPGPGAHGLPAPGHQLGTFQ